MKVLVGARPATIPDDEAETSRHEVAKLLRASMEIDEDPDSIEVLFD